jgi:hypothetical protein
VDDGRIREALMIEYRAIVFVLNGAVLFSIACGSAPAEEATSAAAGETVAGTCFNVRDTRGFHALHDRYVYVKCLRDKHFLLTIDQGCGGLSFATSLFIGNEFNRVCSHSGAMITYREFDRTRRCRILEVESVESLEAAERLVRERVDRTDDRNGESPSEY